MPKIEQNGPDFKYVVTYQRVDLENAVEHVANVQNPEAWHYVVPDRNLGIFKPFRITVKANSARGDSTADLNAVIGYSGEDGMLLPEPFHLFPNFERSILKSCERSVLKTNEAIYMEIGTSSPRSKGMKWSTLQIRRSKVTWASKVTWGQK